MVNMNAHLLIQARMSSDH